MSNKVPIYAYILAVVLGLVAFIFTPPASFLILAFVFLLAGGLFGFLWAIKSWRWGLWIAGPMVVFLSLSVLFSGYLDIFLKKDLPPLLIAIIAACLGSYIAAWYKGRAAASL